MLRLLGFANITLTSSSPQDESVRRRTRDCSIHVTQFPNLISLIRDIRVIRCYSNSGEHLDRHLGFSVRGMERKFLSGRSVNGEDVAVLRRTLFDHRDQLHFSPHSGAENNRELENTDAGQISVRAQSAPEDHALVEAEGLRRHARILLKSRNRPGRTTWSRPVSTTADF